MYGNTVYSTPDFSGRVIRAVYNGVSGLVGALGSVTSHKHSNAADTNYDPWYESKLRLPLELNNIGAFGITAPGL